MFKLTVTATGAWSKSNSDTSRILIEELGTDNAYVVGFGGESGGCDFDAPIPTGQVSAKTAHEKIASFKRYLNQQKESCYTFKVITLYSNRNCTLADFIGAYTEKFGTDQSKNYNYITNNCSDAVNFTIKFFLFFNKDRYKVECIYQTYKLLTCACWFACACGNLPQMLFGLNSPCEAPPGLNSPNGIWKKALLWTFFGQRDENTLSLLPNDSKTDMEEKGCCPPRMFMC